MDASHCAQMIASYTNDDDCHHDDHRIVRHTPKIATEDITTAKSSGYHHHHYVGDYDIVFSNDSHFHLFSLLICDPHFLSFKLTVRKRQNSQIGDDGSRFYG